MVAAVVSLPAYAAEDCAAIPEAIVKMNEPEYASNAVWDAVYGEQTGQERFAGGVILESGYVLAVGERFAYESESADVIVAQIDPFGRVVQEVVQKVPNLRAVNKVVGRKTGFVAVGRMREDKGSAKAWIGFFDFGGTLMHSKVIDGGKFSIDPRDIVPMQNGEGYLLAAAAQDRVGAQSSHLYKLDANGNVMEKKTFAPGVDNTILSLSPVGADYFMGTGYMRGDDGRKTGWLVLYNKDAEIIWQRQYPRGKESILNRAIKLSGGYVVVAGESQPAGGGNRAAWVMLVHRDSGDIVWQRYYTGKIDFSARDILVSKNVFSVLLDGMTPEKTEEPSYIRILTLNPRARVLSNEKYENGEGVHAYRILPTPSGERIVLGSTDMSYRVKPAAPVDPEAVGPFKAPEPVPEAKEEEVLQRSMDGWAIATVHAPSYDDPCAVAE